MSRLSFRPRPLDIHKKLPIVKSVKEFEDDDAPSATTSTRNSLLQRIATTYDNEKHQNLGKRTSQEISTPQFNTIETFESLLFKLEILDHKARERAGVLTSLLIYYWNMPQLYLTCNNFHHVASCGIDSSIGYYINADSNVAAQSKLKKVSAEDFSVNAKCKLLHWSVDGAVAECRIASTDSKAKVHHVPLSGSYWKVWIDRAFVEKVELIRPNEEIFFLEDAIGSTVAWASMFIVLSD